MYNICILLSLYIFWVGTLYARARIDVDIKISNVFLIDVSTFRRRERHCSSNRGSGARVKDFYIILYNIYFLFFIMHTYTHIYTRVAALYIYTY